MNNEIFSKNTEEALLNIVLTSPELYYSLRSIEPGVFSSPVHRAIFMVIKHLSEEGLSPDHQLVRSYLESEQKLDTVGGIEYLEYIKGLHFNKGNLSKYESILVNSYKARKLISLANTIQAEVINAESVSDYIQELMSSIQKLSDSNSVEDTLNMEEALREAWEAIKAKVNSPGIDGVSFGFSSLDYAIGGISAGEVWTIGARPGMGKSAVMVNSALRTAMAGNPALVFSLEMRTPQLMERFVALMCDIAITDIKLGNLSKGALDRISAAIKILKDYPIFIDSNFYADISYMEATIRKYVKNHGVRIVYIDYLQLMAERTVNQTQEIGFITRRLKLLANSLGISIVVLTQLNRNVEMRDDKRPILADIKQSGSVEEDSDIVIFLYRDIKYNPQTDKKDEIEFLVRKNRSGATGVVGLKFHETTNKITDA